MDRRASNSIIVLRKPQPEQWSSWQRPTTRWIPNWVQMANFSHSGCPWTLTESVPGEACPRWEHCVGSESGNQRLSSNHLPAVGSLEGRFDSALLRLAHTQMLRQSEGKRYTKLILTTKQGEVAVLTTEEIDLKTKDYLH